MTATTTQALDHIDQSLLSEVQKRFPFEHRPFEILGERLGIAEHECLMRVSRLKAQQMIRRISARFDAAALGYGVTLVAMRVDPERIDAVAEIVNRHPGVSQSESRSDAFNFWCTLAVPPGDALERVVAALCRLANVDGALLLPIERLYKADDVSDADMPEEVPWSSDMLPGTARLPLSTQDIQLIRLFQEDLPIMELPFAVWAELAETTEDALFAWAKRMEHVGYIQRFAAIVPPRAAAPRVDVLWRAPASDLDTLGEAMARFHEVSCCARRPMYTNWPYGLFTRLRAEHATACLEMIERITARVGPLSHKLLFRVKAYTQRRIVYFTPELDHWWSEAGKDNI